MKIQELQYLAGNRHFTFARTLDVFLMLAAVAPFAIQGVRFFRAVRFRTLVSALAVLCLPLLMAVPGTAQTTTADVVGTVTDPSGAVLSNAKVTVENLATHGAHTAQTTSSGDYDVPFLLPGHYAVRVEVAGFKTFSVADITLPPASARYVVIASRGRFDEEAVEQALHADIAYVALVANKKRAREIQRSLELKGQSLEKLAKVRAPAGLDIGAESPEEIALSIMAEIVSEGRNSDEKKAGKGS